MVLLKDCTECSTLAVRGLDDQLVFEANVMTISPAQVQNFSSDEGIELGEAVFPWLQAPAVIGLKQAVQSRGQAIVVNSAFRALAGQQLLRNHYEAGRCGIVAAAQPGGSNHNNASAIDVRDADDCQKHLERFGYKRLGIFDPMHYDFIASGIKDIRSITVQAFQQLWNRNHPADKLAIDGDFGAVTQDRLQHSPCEGFLLSPVPRILKLTNPIQIGKDVGQLQLALRKHGIAIEKADCIFGPSLQLAVEEFQEKNGLIVDGIVGETTRNALSLGASA